MPRGFTTVNESEIPPWSSDIRSSKGSPIETQKYPANKELTEKVALWTGDITTLNVDAIVNSTNSSLLGDGGADEKIHEVAGQQLLRACEQLGGCAVGEAKSTPGYNLPAKYVIHTVGPQVDNPMKLKSCYLAVLEEAKKLQVENKITLAFSCISTGAYAFPNLGAAHIALETVRQWLMTPENATLIKKIIFCVYTTKDEMIYERLLDQYFPMEDVKEFLTSRIADVFTPPPIPGLATQIPSVDHFFLENNSD